MQRLFGVRRLLTSAKYAMQQRSTFSTSMLYDFKESVAQFAQENIALYASKIDRTDNFPEEVNLWKLMGDFNLLGITAPEAYGGMNLGYLYHTIAMEEISRACGGVGLSYGVH